ncbi:MAG: hypothetical protein HZB29_10175 [Nitrospinae bacterium]|nr:hypothetical protein [Nitrospinota bacterium]
MIRRALKKEFEKGRAVFYLFAAVPVALAVSHPLPAAFTPFISAAFAFPVFFYYVRRENYQSAFVMTAIWAAFQFVAASLMAVMDPAGMTGRLGAPGSIHAPFAYMQWGTGEFQRFARMMADAVYCAALAGISGGAFFLAILAVKLNDAALTFGRSVHGSAGFWGALTVFKFAKLALWAGQTLFAMGPSAVFYMKLEGRQVKFMRPLAVMALGTLLILLVGLFGEV